MMGVVVGAIARATASRGVRRVSALMRVTTL